MKSIISKALIACAAIVSFASCTQEMEYKDVKVTAVNALYEPADNKAVELQASATAALFFEWESAKAEDGGAPLYEVVFDKAGGNFSNPIYKVLSDGNGARNYATISHKLLNSIGAKAGLMGGETGNIIWTVVASRGIATSAPGKVHTIALTRLLGFEEIPSQVFLVGDAVEGGSIGCTSPAGGEFQVFVKLEAGNAFKLADSADAAGKTFHISGTKILESEGTYTVEESGVYRINMDFNIASAKMQKIDKVEFYFSPEGKTLFDMPYAGNGVFSATAAIEFKQEGWGRDERYWLKMTYADGSAVKWGADPGCDSRPGAAGPEDRYWVCYEYGNLSQWDNKWKLNGDFDYKNPFVISLHLNEGTPRHFVTAAK